MKRLIAVLVIVALVVVWLVFNPFKRSENNNNSPTRRSTDVAQRGNLTIAVNSTGVIEPTLTVELKSKASGEIVLADSVCILNKLSDFFQILRAVRQEKGQRPRKIRTQHAIDKHLTDFLLALQDVLGRNEIMTFFFVDVVKAVFHWIDDDLPFTIEAGSFAVVDIGNQGRERHRIFSSG